jgi:TRAP-type mannitol/chloroaromatic compound transport system permease large subunit
MSNPVFGLVGLAALFGIIFIGFPIAFTLGAVALGTGFIAYGPMVFDLAVLQTFSVMKDTVLASIPFFLFMGFLLEQSGLMERMFTGIQQLLAGLRGSLVPGRADHRDDLRRRHRHRRLLGHPARRHGRAGDDQERLRHQA